jgi:hypothetical protein
MRKYWLMAVAVLVVSASAGDALAACSTAECLHATRWHGGFTAIVMTHDDFQGARGAEEFVTSKGAKIAIVTPRLMLGWVPPRITREILGKQGIVEVVRGPLNLNRLKVPGKSDHAETQGRLVGGFYNAVVTGALANQVEHGLRIQGPPLVGDGIPRIEREEHQHDDGNLRVGAESHTGGPPWTNEFMLGRVVVNVFELESDGSAVQVGSPDPNTYTWSGADMNTNINQALMGLTFWSNEASARGRSVTFYVGVWGPWESHCQQGYEPILHSSNDDYLWVNEVMRDYVPPYIYARPGGYGASPVTWTNVLTQVEAFNNDQRNGMWPPAENAFCVFVGYNPVGAPQTFTNGYFAYAYYGGPFTQMLHENGGWGPTNFNRVMTHETGHIFWACDEYYQAGYGGCTTCANCRGTYGPRTWATNQACANPSLSCTASTAICMMKSNDFQLCAYTPAQVGW